MITQTTIKVPEGTAHYALMDGSAIAAAGLDAKWGTAENMRMWNYSYSDFKRQCIEGDLSLVDESDKFLTHIEDQVPMSRGWRNIDDVVGAVPNIPAFLAGHPQCMRRRARVAKDNAPLFIFADVSSSAVISAAQIRRRGVAILALVRMLSAHRPVELWVGATLGDKSTSALVAWKIETAPLDLARAGFFIADEKMARGFGYAICNKMAGHRIGGAPFGAVNTHPKEMEYLKRVTGWGDVLYLPAIHYTDPSVKDPIGWLKRVMATYVNPTEGSDDE